MRRDRERGSIGFHYLLKVFQDAIKIDIWDINFFFSDPDAFKWSLIQIESPKNRFRKGLLFQTSLFFGRMGRSFVRLFHLKSVKTRLDKPVVFFGLTKNQIDSLTPVFEKTRDVAVIVDGTTNYNWNVLILFSYLVSLIFFPFAIRDYIASKGINKEGIKYNFSFHWLTYGMYFVLRVLFHKAKMQCIILANDHIMETRVIIKAAKDEEISTFYLQHASVTRVFPPLNVDFALLEGFDSLGHYESAGHSNTCVFLIGSPKFDRYIEKINLQKKMDSLGICINLLDPYDRVKTLIIALKNCFPDMPITLRIHPREKERRVWEELANVLATGYSDSLCEGVYDFLSNVDAIIAGNSNVHLDAAMLNVFPIYYDFPADSRNLYYSFLEKGLCVVARDEEAACEFVLQLKQKKPDIRIKAKVYCDTVNTKHDGLSGDLASSLIRKYLQLGRIDLEKWEPIRESSLKAFKLPSMEQ